MVEELAVKIDPRGVPEIAQEIRQLNEEIEALVAKYPDHRFLVLMLGFSDIADRLKSIRDDLEYRVNQLTLF